MLLADTDIQEQLSVVYLSALATSAGFVFAQENLDRTGTDLIVRGGRCGFPQIDWQIKACKILPAPKNGTISYPLKRRNYDLLIERSGHPRLLMIYQMPEDKPSWLHCDEDQMVLKKCAYWVSLKGCPASDNDVSVTVQIPVNQVLTIQELARLMDEARQGKI
jgi:hypothetical protein